MAKIDLGRSNLLKGGVTIDCQFSLLLAPELARLLAETGDTTSSRRAYQDFLALWKDADPDIPILQEAKAEYAKLR